MHIHEGSSPAIQTVRYSDGHLPHLEHRNLGGAEATTIEAGHATMSWTGQGVARRIPLRMKAKVVIGTIVADLATGWPASLAQ
ncbi:MAG: DUF3108 domain-containing protein [Gemmatimonadota bacterium]|nr:DUF3108 domain-containing protein [Gemmatimonadota bacterium]